MAKVTLTFVDKAPGQRGDVECICDPPFAELVSRIERGHMPTNAEAFAVHAMLAVREKSKENSKTKGPIHIPKLRRLM